MNEFKSGFVAIVGKPNAGKSTLINKFVGERVAIVSYKPQTTRDKILGIVNGEGYQIVFIDTPGLHRAKNKLSKYMMKNVDHAVDGVDAVVYVIACDKGVDDNDISYLTECAKNGLYTVVALNKIDCVKPEHIAEQIEKLKSLDDIGAIMPISALKEKYLGNMLELLVKRLPEGVKYYDDEMYTDRDLRFLTGEIIREKLILSLNEEIPYGTGVIVNKYAEGGKVIEIDADIVCEKKAHKPIIIGKNGAMLKQIGSAARKDIEKLVGTKVFLTLWVRIREEWRDDPRTLGDLGYEIKN